MDEKTKISSETFMYVLYVLYRANILTRYNLGHIFEAIKKDQPEDITKFLVEEEARKG